MTTLLEEKKAAVEHAQQELMRLEKKAEETNAQVERWEEKVIDKQKDLVQPFIYNCVVLIS